MDGIIVIDKPSDYTSFDVVAVMRRLCHEKKIGHTGTLDPMATGVLPLLLGKATRAASLLPDTSKEYEAGFVFGYATDTLDSTGKTLDTAPAHAARAELEAVLPRFRGDILQIPPMYSALRKDGVRLYDLARQGVEVEREARPVTIEKLECTAFDEAKQTGCLTVRCSKGTYIRTLCADIAAALGTLGVMTSLRRTAASGFTLAQGLPLDEARRLSEAGTLAERLLPVERLFEGLPSITVTAPQAARFCNGGALDAARLRLPPQTLELGNSVCVNAPEGSFLGLGELAECLDDSGNPVLRLKVKRLFLNA